MKIYYGIENVYQDVTNYFIKDRIFIPTNDNQRCLLFGDPLPNIVKHIKIEDDDKNVQIYSSEEVVYLTKDNQKSEIPSKDKKSQSWSLTHCQS